VTDRFVSPASDADDVPEWDDRPSIDALESQITELERELVYWRNRAIADWAKSAERVRAAEAKTYKSNTELTLRKSENRKLQGEVTRLKKQVAAFERRFGSRVRRKSSAMLRRLGLR
jgi:dipeptidase